VERSILKGRSRLAPRVAGEFLIIVVGVLVAFALEDWSSSRAERETQREYLEALAADVRQDSASWANLHLRSVPEALAILEAVAPIARGELPIPADTAAFIRDLSVSHIIPFLREGGPTYEELLATGSLRLIESSEVRSGLIAFYRLKAVARQRSDSNLSGFGDLVDSYLPAGIGRGDLFLGGSGRGPELLGEVFDVEEALLAVRTPEFRRALNRHLNYLGTMQTTYEGLFAAAVELIPMIDAAVAELE